MFFSEIPTSMNKYQNKESSGAFPLIKSDDLSNLQAFFKDNLGLELFADFFQLSIIVDANVIIADLIWLTKTREKSKARTALQEVIAAETLIAVAPQWLEDEIQENIPEVSKKEGIPAKKLWNVWNKYRKLIEFKDQSRESIELPDNIQDPDDLPYLLLQQDTGHVIYSRDSHLDKMGATLIDSTVIMTLRDYSRYEAVELKMFMNSFLVTGIGIGTLKLMWNILNSSFKAFTQLPDWLKYFIIILLVGAFVHPYTRNGIITFLKNGSEKASTGIWKIFEELEPIFDQFAEAQEKSDLRLSELLNKIPEAEKKS